MPELPPPPIMLDRRSLLRRGVALTGGLALAGTFGGLLTACGDDSETSSSPETTAGGSGGSTGGSLTKVAYQLSWLPTVEHAGAYIAKRKGYYEENGLDVDIVPGGPNVQSAATVASGKAQIGGTNADAIASAVLEGAKLKIFAVRMQKSPYCILSRADNALKTPQDMIGKKIGVAQSNTTAFQLLLKLNDIKESDLTVVPVQFDPTPVANGEVDGQIVFAVNEPGQLKLKGVDTNIFLLADFGYAMFSGCYFATDDTIKNQKDMLVSFLRAEIKGWEDNLADPKIGADLTVNDFGKDLGLDPEHQLWESEELETLMVTENTKKNGLLSMDPVDIDNNIKTLAAAGIEIEASALFTDEIYAAL